MDALSLIEYACLIPEVRAVRLPKLKRGQTRCRTKCRGCKDLCGKKRGHGGGCEFYPRRLFKRKNYASTRRYTRRQQIAMRKRRKR